MQLVSLCRELFFSYWWCDWVKASKKDDKTLDSFTGKQSLYLHPAGDSNAETLRQATLDRKLLIAAEKRQVSRAKRLLRLGANIHCIGNYGQTPIHVASQHCHKDTIDVLLRAGAKINAENGNDNTPLHLAAMHAVRAENIEILVQAGGNVAHVNNRGETPLHKARSDGVVVTLSRAGADVDCRDGSGQTPLHKAATAKVAAALLRAGADVNCRDQSNLTPLHLVWQNAGTDDVVDLAKIYVDAGADLSACTNVPPNFVADADNKSWTPAAWIECQPPRMRCTYPFGPSRSMRAAHARRMAAHAEVLAFLKARSKEQGNR